MGKRFWKYQGTGNDFILFDGRTSLDGLKDNTKLIKRLCDRRFGIGADGLIILEEDNDRDFRMVYYNADGRQSTMCGNGGRCSIAFANEVGLADTKTVFEAVDGAHDGELLESGWVVLGMKDVQTIERKDDRTVVMDTGSPHYVKWLKEDEELDIVEFGRSIRYSEAYKGEGINVNTFKVRDDHIEVATYERGVEDETYSCGTGVTACAIAFSALLDRNNPSGVSIKTKGGDLKVDFMLRDGVYRNVYLSGPAQRVFQGEIDLTTLSQA